eukprot:symbB.v1.2.036264.t1/scaffold5070.1/size36720/3
MAMADPRGAGPDARAKVRESMKQLLQKGGPISKVKELPKTGQVETPKVTVDFGYSKFDQIGREEETAEVMDASKRNEEFFRQLEKDYGQMCKQDGWDEVLKAAKDEPKTKARPFEEIPADSDYHRVALQGGGRELRFDPERGRQLLAQLPQKPRRNLDALRKVEAETREAMEKEKKRLAEMPKSEPIRTRSEVVYLDTLDDDSEAESPKMLGDSVQCKIQVPMGRASMTRKSPRDGEEDEACVDSMKLLPDLVKEVMRNQHEDFLKHLDSRLDSLCRRIQKENSFIPVRSGSRMQSQSSRHTRTSPTSPSPPTSPSRAASLKLYPPSSSFLARAMTTTIEQAEQAEKAEKAEQTEQTEQAEQGFERSTSHESEADAMPALTHKASDVKSDTSDLGMPKTLTTEVTQVEKRELPKGSARSSVQSAKSVEKTSTSVTNRESEDGLNSYDLAHRQGSRVDFFKKQMMMSSSDVVGSGDLGSGCCSPIQTACAMVVKSVWCELFFALMIVSNSVYLGVQLEMTASNPHLAGSKQELFFA